MSIINGKVTAPISMSNISTAIGSGSNDLGTNCKSTNINKWSYYKPISYPTASRLTDEQINSRNDGFTIHTFTNAVDLFNSYAEGSSWTYARPAGGSTAPFRMSDFIGYYHEAKAWLNPSFSKSEMAPNETMKCNLSNLDNTAYYSELGWEINLDWVINNLDTFKNINKNEINIGFLLSRDNGGARGVYWYNLGNFQDLELDKGLTFKALATFPQDTYYIAPCLSTLDSVPAGTATYIRDDDYTFVGTFFALPCELSTIKINTSSGSSTVANIELIEGEEKRAYTFGEYDVLLDSVNFTFHNNNSGDVRVYYRVEAGGAINPTVLLSSSVNVSNGYSSPIYVENCEWTTGVEISEIGIFVTVYYWLQGQQERSYKFIIREGNNK